MDNTQIYAALSAAIRLARLNLQQQAAMMGATQVISCAALLPDWQPGAYTTGQVANHNGQPWRCLQDHDSTGNDTWSPVPPPVCGARITAPQPNGRCHGLPPPAPTTPIKPENT